MAKIKIVWRDCYNEAALAAIEKHGTLDREEIELEGCLMDGEEAAAMIAEKVNEHDFERFRDGGHLVILEPAEFAGTYSISVDWQPIFHAISSD